MNIDQPTPEMAKAHQRARVIRDVVAGEYQMRLCGETYLPRFRANQSNDEYERFKATTPFFPATSRTAQGRRGLMFAKNVVLKGSALDPIRNVITPQGDDWRSASEHIVYDTFQSNYTGLLPDHPSVAEGVELNAANALEQGFRPFLHVFPLESILETTRGLVRNRQMWTRIRLLENVNRVLELLLIDGQYVQRIHENINGHWRITKSIKPAKGGVPLDEIPFEIVSDNKCASPQPCILEDVARLNIAHYVAQGRINALQVFGSGLVPILKGIEPEKKMIDGVETLVMPPLHMGPGGYLLLPNPDSDFGFLEPEGKMAADLRASAKDLEDKMAKVGARMLAAEAVAPEATETVMMRNAAEDSITGSLAQTYAARISRALARMAWWMTPDPINGPPVPFTGEEAKLTLNMDYRTHGMTAQERQVAMAEWQAGVSSWETLFHERQDRGVINSSLTVEQERDRIETENLDRPSTEAL